MDCIGCESRIYEQDQWEGGAPDLCGECQLMYDPTLHVGRDETPEMPHGWGVV